MIVSLCITKRLIHLFGKRLGLKLRWFIVIRRIHIRNKRSESVALFGILKLL